MVTTTYTCNIATDHSLNMVTRFWDSNLGPPIPRWTQYHYTKGSDPEVRKNHLRHYTLVTTGHIFTQGFCLVTMQQIARVDCNHGDAKKHSSHGNMSFVQEWFLKTLHEVRNGDTLHKKVWFSQPTVPEVTCHHRKSRVVSDSTDGATSSPLGCLESELEEDDITWTHWDQGTVLYPSVRNIAIVYTCE